MTTSADDESIRLNKYIAQQLAVGRRQADILITQGRARVNGQRATLGSRILLKRDSVTVDDKPLQSGQTFLYLKLHKPVGYICSRRQQGNTPTVFSLLPQKYQHLKTVGRLDKDSSGLILLTNDGDFAHRMTHPRFVKQKQYEIELDKPLAPLHQQIISDQGVQLPDGLSRLQLQRLQDGNSTEWLVVMHEGRNRQIRRTFSAMGYAVTKLHRTHFSPFNLGNLPAGEYQEVQPTDLS